ncbi:MAG: DmsC/YnfH family molybdoenzyme membrane anchor subunit [Gammaproteobacteria bacterium]|nr:DmsC/YnfH family molybdoenzyme membrane anchor subunit [Gammaproteobacteria bacterium]
MHPAFSVIFFTVFSGIGYGLLALMGLFAAFGVLPLTRSLGLLGLGLGFAAVSAGLLSSTWHLGHPERSWRAFTQWRSSWLSREGVLAVATYVPIVLLAYCWIYLQGDASTLKLWAVLTAVGAVVTVACTGMIYQSLKTIHQWHNQWTVPNYLLLGLSGGALWLNALTLALGDHQPAVGVIAVVAAASAWVVKSAYWRFIDTTSHPSTPETATGLGRFGKVTRFEGPHTEANYLLKEMGFRVARKHAMKLRRYAQILAFALPLVLTAGSLLMDGGAATSAAILAALSVTGGLLIERWLFFAEAKHVVTLYYGSTAA